MPSGIAGHLARALSLSLAASLLACGAASAALAPGQILVASQTHDALMQVNPANGKQTLFASNSLPVNASSAFFVAPTDVTISPSGRIYVLDTGAFDGFGGVIAVDPNTGKQTKISANDQSVNSFSKLFNSPDGIALTASGRILVADRSAFGGDGGVIAVDPATGKETEFSSNEQPVNATSKFFSDVRGGITVLRSGTVLVGNTGTVAGLIAIDPATGKESRFSTNDQPVNGSSMLYELAVGVTEASTGRVFVSDQNGPPSDGTGGVIGVNPATGKESLVSDNELAVNASSTYFSSPFDLAFGLDGRLVVLDTGAFGSSGCGDLEGCGGLISVDTATGKEGVISSNTQAVNTADPLFHGIFGLAIVPPRCLGKAATIYGTPKGEVIRGTPGPDVIAALGGNDKVSSLGGNDRVCGGAGGDAIRGGKGRDRLRGDAGGDGLFGGRGRDVLIGGKGRDLLKGGPGRDRQRQ